MWKKNFWNTIKSKRVIIKSYNDVIFPILRNFFYGHSLQKLKNSLFFYAKPNELGTRKASSCLTAKVLKVEGWGLDRTITRLFVITRLIITFRRLGISFFLNFNSLHNLLDVKFNFPRKNLIRITCEGILMFHQHCKQNVLLYEQKIEIMTAPF